MIRSTILAALLSSNIAWADTACLEASFYPVHWAYSGAMVILHLKSGQTVTGSVLYNSDGVITLRSFDRRAHSAPSYKWNLLRSKPIEFVFEANPAEYAFE